YILVDTEVSASLEREEVGKRMKDRRLARPVLAIHQQVLPIQIEVRRRWTGEGTKVSERQALDAQGRRRGCPCDGWWRNVGGLCTHSLPSMMRTTSKACRSKSMA